MNEEICPLHDDPMELKSGQYGDYFSHTIPNVGYCNGKKITPFKSRPVNGSTPTAPSQVEGVKPAISLVHKPANGNGVSYNPNTALNNANQLVIAMIEAGMFKGQDIKVLPETLRLAGMYEKWLEGERDELKLLEMVQSLTHVPF